MTADRWSRLENLADANPNAMFGARTVAEMLRVATGWQPIETAPRDMTEVIVLCGRKDVRLGWYFAPSSDTFGWLDQNGKSIKPDFWMPLPPAPKEGE